MSNVPRDELVRNLFDDAVSKSPSDIEEYLDRSCPDEEIRKDVLALLRADNGEAKFLKTTALQISAAEMITELAMIDVDPIVGTSVGQYRIVRPLGHGGMGTVYLAERADGEYQKLVAIKILRAGVLTKTSLQRFHNERQILAELDHPNIAHLIDAGSTESGLPYFVMEYVEGLTIDRYCSEQKLSLDRRLEMFRQICSAVEFAHKSFVIHRDIKPKNILVTNDGVPKLLDFGIAKILQSEANRADNSTSATAETRIMTPEYASPEQIKGRRLTSATDIYSLGALLYELLTGERPHSSNDHRSGFEIAYEICESKVIPPSLRWQRSGKDLFNSAYRIDRDLDKIVLMALRKEPERRYVDAAQLSDDVRRYLGRLPVHARGDSFLYRGSKLVSRNKLTFALAASVAVGVIFFMTIVLQRPVSAGSESVAVMPFVNASNDSRLDNISDGLTSGLIDRLSSFSQLAVPTRASVFRYKDQAISPHKIGQELNVQTILLGTITLSKGNLAVQVILLDSRTKQPIWTEQYVGSMSDIDAVKEQLVINIANKLGIPMPQQDYEPNDRGSADAYRLYLKGRYFWYQRNPRAIQNSLSYYQQAIASDPEFALAYSGIADSYILLGLYGMVPIDNAFTQAKTYALRAIELQPELSEAHTSLGAINWLHEWDWKSADASFKRAVELNPNSAPAHHWYGLFLAEMGRTQDAISISRRAVVLDPMSTIINADFGRVLYYARRYDDSLAQFEATAEMQSGILAYDVTFVYEQLGRKDEWFAVMEKNGSIDSHDLRTAYWREGLNGFWKKRTEIDERNGSTAYFGRAEDYARIGEVDKAFDMLEQAFRHRSFGMAQLKANPVLDPLRSDPRYDELLRKMKLDS